MFEFDPKEFPEIEKDRADAHKAVQEWLVIKQRWENVRGADALLPLEAYPDHPAYKGLCKLIEHYSEGLISGDMLSKWACQILSAISSDPEGEVLISGKRRENWKKQIAFHRILFNAALNTSNLAEALNSAICFLVHSFIDEMLWDELFFITPLSIRMRLEVNNAK